MQKAISALALKSQVAEDYRHTRDILVFKSHGTSKLKPFRWQQTEPLKAFKVFGTSGQSDIAGFSVNTLHSEVRLGCLDHPYFSEVVMPDTLQTIRVRDDGYWIKEIQFKGKELAHQATTNSTGPGAKWNNEIKLQEGEEIVGIYGEWYKQDY